MNGKTIRRGIYDFKRVKDGVYLASKRDEKDSIGGIVYTTDVRGRKWNAIDFKGKDSGKAYRTMSLAAESIMS